jgi:hypothetical protein
LVAVHCSGVNKVAFAGNAACVIPGEPPDWAGAKHVILELLRRHGGDGGVGKIIEYHRRTSGGPSLTTTAATNSPQDKACAASALCVVLLALIVRDFSNASSLKEIEPSLD